MKFFAVVPALLAAVAAEAQLPIAPQFLGQAGLYRGPALQYAPAYSAPANFAYGAPITALNAASAPIVAAPAPAPVVASYSAAVPAVPAVPAVAAVAAVPAVAAPVIAKAAPVIAKAAPVIAKAAPITTAHSSQYQAQDELGNIAYGYQNINSAKQETGNAYGGVTGSYSYTDEAGVHTVNYVADDLGFRVTSDNLPVGPANLAVAPVHVAEPVQDTPAVVEAKAAFFKAYNAAKSGVVKRSAQTYAAGLPAFNYAGLQPYGSLVGHANGAVVPVDTAEVSAAKVAHAAAGGAIHPAPLAYNLPAAPLTPTYAAAPAIAAPAIAAPVTYSGVSALNYAAAPVVADPRVYAGAGAALREASLTTIKLNPGHATFYRVD